MIDVLRSELLKLRTIRLHVWLTLGVLGLLIVVVALVASLGDDPRGTGADDLMGLIGGFSVLVAMATGVVSTLGITSEFTYLTIRPTLAATPRRTDVFVAKALLSTAYGLATGCIAVGVSYPLGAVVLAGRDGSVGLSSDDGSLPVFFGIPIFCALLALFGYGVGLLLRNAPAAAAVIVLWPLLVEPIVNVVLGVAGVGNPTRVLPYTSAFALVIPDVDAAPGGRLYGAVFFGLFALAITAVGVVVNNRRDA